jgi:arsenate reductase (glutaredoxin)
MLKIYHNPRCRKSREGLDYLAGKTDKYEIVDYLKIGISAPEVLEIASKMGEAPSNLVRTQEDYYKKELKGRDINEDEWASILSKNPRLIQRPMIVTEYKAVLAQPPEKMDNLL